MDKIKKYNQILLSILGTLSIILLVVLGITLVFDFFQYNDFSQDDGGIVSNEIAQENQEDNLRKYLINFDGLKLLDSLSEKYIIPVNQTTLEEEEELEYSDLLNEVSSFTGGRKRNNYGERTYNNIIVYGLRDDTYEVVYQERISIISYQIVDKKYLFLEVVVKDSNQDKYLNSKDLKELHILDIDDMNLIRIKSPEKNYLQFRKLLGKENYVMKYGIDRNNDGEFQFGIEPQFYYKVNFETGKLNSLISEEQIIELQKILDGAQ